MKHRFCLLALIWCFSLSSLSAAERSATPSSVVSMSLPGTPVGVPQQQEMDVVQPILAPVDPSDHHLCGDRSCCVVFYLCADCLERKRDRFPASLVVAYGRCCARLLGWNREPELRARYERLAANGINPGPDDPQIGDCAWCFTEENWGDARDYHCNGRIIKYHCMCCAVSGFGLASCIVGCVRH